MTKEELIKLSRENLRKSKQGSLCECYDEAFIKGYELSKKCIEELEQKISVLLSCKKCSENKGGYICQKEYEDKCLAQKIQYIKELQEENKVLAQNLEDTEILNKTYEKKNKELKTDYEVLSCSVGDFGELQNKLEEEQRKNNGLSDNLTKAKELLKWFVWYFREGSSNLVPYKHKVEEVEQFLNEVEK